MRGAATDAYLDYRQHAYTHEAVGMAKAEIRGVYVVAGVSAAGPWGQGAGTRGQVWVGE